MTPTPPADPWAVFFRPPRTRSKWHPLVTAPTEPAALAKLVELAARYKGGDWRVGRVEPPAPTLFGGPGR